MSRTMRICTWNIQLGLHIKTILQEIKGNSEFRQLDLLALQEASVHDMLDDARSIADVLGTTYDCYQVTADLYAGRVQANALIWNSARVHVKNTGAVKLPRRHEVGLPLGERTLLRALRAPQRISLVADACLEADTLRIYLAHLDVIGFEHKREQLSRILRDARERAVVDLTILAGDLNTFKIRSRPSWQGLITAAKEAGFHDITAGIGWTHAVRSLNMRQKLDAIFVSRGRPFQYRSWTLEARGSDHIPLFADITLD